MEKKLWHEVRDPVHGFIRFNNDEKEIIDSLPLQRLKCIHQLAMTYQVYPGATHKRFEHSLGVMELAGRAYDVITTNPRDDVRAIFKENLDDKSKLIYWRKALRMAALLHDIGHLPFSHAAEKELMPQGTDHETMTKELINSKIKPLLEQMRPAVSADDVIKIALGSQKSGQVLDSWEIILADIIRSDSLGVDRMDYLLRDSYYAGVPYGSIDSLRLIDTLKILPSAAPTVEQPPKSSRRRRKAKTEQTEPRLGISADGIHAAEALLLARYFMYTQVYFHPVRRAYDAHLREFLKEWLDNGKFDCADCDGYLNYTDDEILTGIKDQAKEKGGKGHKHAEIIVGRQHYRLIYDLKNDDPPGLFDHLVEACTRKFGRDCVLHEQSSRPTGEKDFPVERSDGEIVSSLNESGVIKQIPDATFGYIFTSKELREEVIKFVKKEKGRFRRAKDAWSL